MVFMTPKNTGNVALSTGILGGILLASPVRADLTYVTKIVGGVSSTSTTTYVKGNRLRTEAEGTMTITDGVRTWLIDTNKKTYSIVVNEKLGQMGGPMLEQFRQMIDIKMDTRVKPGGKSRTILGKPARNYVFTMSMQMNFKPGSGPKAPTGDRAIQLPVLSLKGETWTTDAVSLAPSILKSAGAGAIFSRLGMLGSSVEKSAAAFESMKGFPLETTMTQSMTGMPKGQKGGEARKVTFSVVSLKTDTLPDSLFQPPKGFKQIPYSAPSMGMGNLGGGM
jgi:hypothetical protein